jgi:hypothetical protein
VVTQRSHRPSYLSLISLFDIWIPEQNLMKDIDPADYQLPPEVIPVLTVRRPPRHRSKEWFVRGPIPWTWLQAAAAVSVYALAFAWVLWREAGRHNRREFPLNLRRLNIGLSRQASSRALKDMEQAELLTIVRRPGRPLMITLLDAPIATDC